jgi:ferritin
MLKEKMFDALSAQLNEEAYSAYMYLSMSGFLTSINMPGMAAWMKAQSQEEMGHAQKFYRYIESRGRQARLLAIQAPPASWDGPVGVFEAALNHERSITNHINGLADLADSEKDRATAIFLQWFVTEQVEEEENVEQVFARLKMLNAHPAGLLMFDRELGARAAK